MHNNPGNLTLQEISAATSKALETFFLYVNEQSPEKIAASFAGEFDGYICESKYMPWTGRRTKRTEIPELFRILFAAFVQGEEEFKIDHIFVDGGEAALFGSASRVVKATGKRFTTSFSMRFTFENGLITRFHMLEETALIERAFIL